MTLSPLEVWWRALAKAWLRSSKATWSSRFLCQNVRSVETANPRRATYAASTRSKSILGCTMARAGSGTSTERLYTISCVCLVSQSTQLFILLMWSKSTRQPLPTGLASFPVEYPRVCMNMIISYWLNGIDNDKHRIWSTSDVFSRRRSGLEVSRCRKRIYSCHLRFRINWIGSKNPIFFTLFFVSFFVYISR